MAGLEVVPRILDVVCRATGMGFAAVARVTGERWVACAVRDGIGFGLVPGGELQVETTLCREVHASHTLIVIDDVPMDATYCDHPTPARYGFRSYISVPIWRSDGSFFGTLCAIDPKPAPVSRPETVGMVVLFAELIAAHLDAQDQLVASRSALLSERRTSELREQFMAVLGHDLRNPLAAMIAGVRLLQAEVQGPNATHILTLMRNTATRMVGLVDNMLDFARDRLGGGIDLEAASVPLAPVLEQVVAEMRATYPDRTITTAIRLDRPIPCDPGRIAQLVSNLLANALTHGAADQPVRLAAGIAADGFRLTVANDGPPLPPALLERLFEPFVRAATGPGQQGLGLGLYIAAAIARAHGGRLEVSSTAAETCFTLLLPLP